MKKRLYSTIVIPYRRANVIKQYLTVPADASPDECLGEDTTICYTAKFKDGKQMDIKCCGVQYREGEDNSAWCEAVLFDENGAQLACADPCDSFFGLWELSYGDTTYECMVSVSAGPNHQTDTPLDFIQQLREISDYWLNVPDQTVDQMVYGTIFSLLVMIDGDSSANDFHRLKIIDTTTGKRLDCGYLHELLNNPPSNEYGVFVQQLKAIASDGTQKSDKNAKDTVNRVLYQILMMMDGKSGFNHFHRLVILDTHNGERLDCGHLHELWLKH